MMHMSNQKTKRSMFKKLLNRKVRGIENMKWAVVATVMVLIVAFAMYNIITGAASTINVPQVQLVPQESFVIGNTANVTLKFGRGFQGVSISIAVPDGNTVMPVSSSCIGSGLGPGNSVVEGQKVTFRCELTRSPGGIAYIVVRWTGGSQVIKWVIG